MDFLIYDVSWWKLPLATLVAFIAGILNATAGGGSFLSYPTLVSLGETHLGANATSTVGLWPGLVANLPGFKHELKTEKRYIKLFVLPTLLGAVLGAWVLTHTSDSLFGYIAPVLIFIGSLVLRFHDKVEHAFDRIHVRSEKRKLVVVTVSVFMISIYAAYFGAGVALLFLAAFSLLHLENFYHSVALKNVLAMAANSVATIYFSFSGLVHWPISLAMAVGSISGGITGARVIRKINRELMRNFVVVYGLITSVVMLIIQIT